MSARFAVLAAAIFIGAAALAGLAPATGDPIVGDYGVRSCEKTGSPPSRG